MSAVVVNSRVLNKLAMTNAVLFRKQLLVTIAFWSATIFVRFF